VRVWGSSLIRLSYIPTAIFSVSSPDAAGAHCMVPNEFTAAVSVDPPPAPVSVDWPPHAATQASSRNAVASIDSVRNVLLLRDLFGLSENDVIVIRPSAESLTWRSGKHFLSYKMRDVNAVI
jgi:hypothetical protein